MWSREVNLVRTRLIEYRKDFNQLTDVRGKYRCRFVSCQFMGYPTIRQTRGV